MNNLVILRLFKDNQLVEVFQFDLERIAIGRKAQVQVDLDSEDISPLHALIERRDNKYFLCDLGSQKGTFLNNNRVFEAQLKSGDKIKCGPYQIDFIDGSQILAQTQTSQVASTNENAVEEKSLFERSEEERFEITEVPQESSIQDKEELDFTQISEVSEVPRKIEDPLIENSVISKVVETQSVSPVVEPPKPADSSSLATPQLPPVFHQEDSEDDLTVSSAIPLVEPDYTAYVSNSESQPRATQSIELKPGRGTSIEVLTLWGNTVIQSKVFRKRSVIRVGSTADAEVIVPGLGARLETLVLFDGSAKVLLKSDRPAKFTLASGETVDVNDARMNGTISQQGRNQVVELPQNEMIRVIFPMQQISVVIRYCETSPMLPVGGGLPVTGSTVGSIVIAMMAVLLLAVYVEIMTPYPTEDEEEETERTATFIYEQKPPPFKIPEPPPPPPVEEKVVVAEKKEMVKAPLKSEEQVRAKTPTPTKEPVGAASATAGNRPGPKKFAAVKSGGSIKTGPKEGASAKEKINMNNVGMFSAFGGQGVRKDLDQGSAGAGDLLGQADKATGVSGSNKNRDGSDIGSAAKDIGALGGGTATQGIAGVKTRGRGTGYTGSGQGSLGEKGQYLVFPSGGEQDFKGSIDKEAVLRVIKAGRNEIQSCYERELNFNPSYGGSVTIIWDIGPRGRVLKSNVVSADVSSERAERCIRDRIEGWKFPDPPEGMVVPVQYTWILDR